MVWLRPLSYVKTFVISKAQVKINTMNYGWISIGLLCFQGFGIWYLHFTHRQTHTHAVSGHSWLQLKITHCLTAFLCVPLLPSMGICSACLYVGWWVFILLICVSGAPHNDNITDCKVPWYKSPHMLCLLLSVCVCICAACVSKQLSQIHSLAQVSLCYLAHVHLCDCAPLCVRVHLCVCDMDRICSE